MTADVVEVSNIWYVVPMVKHDLNVVSMLKCGLNVDKADIRQTLFKGGQGQRNGQNV